MSTDQATDAAGGTGPEGSRAPVAARVLLLLAFLIAAPFSGFLIERFHAAEIRIEERARQEASEATRKTARAIETRLGAVMPAMRSLAEEAGRGLAEGRDMIPRLEPVLRGLPDLLGIGLAYEPRAYRSDIRLHAPFLVREEGGQAHLHRIERDIDYTEFKHQWYITPLLEGARWSEPHSSAGRPESVVDFAVPFHPPATDGATAAPAGIAFGSYSLASLGRVVDELDIDISGYQYVITQRGRFITHPRRELVRSGKTLFEMALEADDPVLFAAAVQASKGKAGAFPHADPITGESALIAHEPIGGLGWSVVTVILTENAFDPTTQRRGLLHILTSVMVAVVAALLLAVQVFIHHRSSNWVRVIVCSLVFASGTAAAWLITHDYPSGETSLGNEIVNRSSLRGFLEAYRRESADLKADAPIFVPTGVFIQSIEFTTSNNLRVTGYVWQKYRRGEHDDVSRGFVLPEAEKPVVVEVYNRPLTSESTADTILSSIGMGQSRDDCTKPRAGSASPGTTGCSQLIGWYFSAVVRQNYSYSSYPFDNQFVSLRLWHKDFDRNIVLVPDLEAYEVTNPAALPGVETDFVLPGWTLKDTAFAYQRHGYNTNFGINRYVGQDNFPELHFNVHISRDFLGPFVLHFLPQFVVATMLFIVLLMGSKRGEQAKWLGFASKDIVRVCAMLIIVLIFAHSTLRRTLFSASLVYLEYFYLVLYVACLSVSVNAVLFAMGRVPVLEYRDNYWPKLLFWPVMTGSAFLITMLSFY